MMFNIVGESLLSFSTTGSLLTTTGTRRTSSFKLGSRARRPDLQSLLIILIKFSRSFGKTSTKMDRSSLRKQSEGAARLTARKRPRYANRKWWRDRKKLQINKLLVNRRLLWKRMRKDPSPSPSRIFRSRTLMNEPWFSRIFISKTSGLDGYQALSLLKHCCSCLRNQHFYVLCFFLNLSKLLQK